MTNIVDPKIFHVELLTPKQNTEHLDDDLQKFTKHFNSIMDAGYIASITDNPLGTLHFQATEILPELGLPVEPEQLIFHVTTFHPKAALDEILTSAAAMGVKHLMTITGDDNERASRLSPASIGMDVPNATSVELLKYIMKQYPNQFTCGVAFNPYEPVAHELEKMRKKVDAGAGFIVTQPIIGRNERLDVLNKFNIPVVVGAWMSKKIELLSECVGYDITNDKPYDPLLNLASLRRNYPASAVHLSLLGFKNQLPLLKDLMGCKVNPG